MAPSKTSSSPADRLAEREPLDAYLEEIRDIPVLDRAGQEEIGGLMVEAETDLRSALAGLPAFARRVVALWNERRARGVVTGALARTHRDGSGTDWSKQIDGAVARIEARLRQLSRSSAAGTTSVKRSQAALEVAVESADLALSVYLEAIEPLAEEADPEEVGGPAVLDALLADAAGARERLLDARNRFITHNLRLVIMAAKSYRG